MKHVIISLILIGPLSLSGCGKDQESVVHNVDWYKTHKSERADVIKKCNANPGELELTPNCINAKRAQSLTVWGGRKGSEVKPLTFDKIK